VTGPHAPARLIYREDRCGVRWPLLLASVAVAVAGTLGFLLLVVMAILLPPMWSFVLLALPLLFGVFRWLRVSATGWRLGIQVDDHQIQIGGLRQSERRRRAGRRPPHGAITVLAQTRAVFTCPWSSPWSSGIEELYLITGRRELKAFIRQYLAETGFGQVPLGFLLAPGMRAGLVIVHNPSLGTSDPATIRAVVTTRGLLEGVTSRVWLIPTRHPGRLRAALAQVPAAPPVREGPPLPTVISAQRPRGQVI
jgi:hypothetical protein